MIIMCYIYGNKLLYIFSDVVTYAMKKSLLFMQSTLCSMSHLLRPQTPADNESNTLSNQTIPKFNFQLAKQLENLCFVLAYST